MKKVALINDLSGFGRCSLTVALPVLSAMGLQCCALPTAILSNHTGYDSYTFYDFSPHMQAFATEWEKLQLQFDGIYTGFLASEQQIDITIDLLSRFGTGAIKIVDPVMGDHGQVYATVTESMQQSMVRLIRHADIITPNMTELCILAGRPYPAAPLEKQTLLDILQTVSAKTGRYIVLTGVDNSICCDVAEGWLQNIVYDKQTHQTFETMRSRIPCAYAGTGDLFASVLCGGILCDSDIAQAVTLAADFVEKCARATYAADGGENDGMQFESLLKELFPHAI